MKGRPYPLQTTAKHTDKTYLQQFNNRTNNHMTENRVVMHSKLIRLQASVLRNVGSTHGIPIISKISFSERGNMSWESRRRLLEM